MSVMDDVRVGTPGAAGGDQAGADQADARRAGAPGVPGAAPAEASPAEPSAKDVVARMRAVCPEADPEARLPGVHPARIPRHIAIIMDGNGRWARERGFPREFGHRSGAAAVRTTIEECGRLGVEVLTLYSFSVENWKRPEQEIAQLMYMYEVYLDGERESMKRRNIRFIQIGRRDGLPAPVVDAVQRLMDETAGNTGPTLCLAVNYGSRAEIADAARAIARKAARGEIDPDAVDERTVADHLYTAGLPDPDLLIRTAGEQRISNYLLWQLSYAEFHFSPVYWPDFGVEALHAAVRDFASRRRRFGGLDPA